MFLFAHAVRSLFTKSAATRARAEAERLAKVAFDADVKVRRMGDSTDVATLVMAKMEKAKAEDAFLIADAKADKWEARRASAKSPSSRAGTYLAGKIDAATAATLLYPYVPQIVAQVKTWVGV